VGFTEMLCFEMITGKQPNRHC